MTLAERKLIAQINHWARRHGWERARQAYRNPTRDLTVAFPCWSFACQYFIGDALVTVVRGHGHRASTSTYPARSVTEAVNILVSVGVLPERFHSIYRALIGMFDEHAERAMALTRDRTAMRIPAVAFTPEELELRKFYR